MHDSILLNFGVLKSFTFSQEILDHFRETIPGVGLVEWFMGMARVMVFRNIN